jgi:hypothetical protein
LLTDLQRCQVYKNNYVNYLGEWSFDNYKRNEFFNQENLIPFNLMNIKMIRNLWKNKTVYYEGTFFPPYGKLIDTIDMGNCCDVVTVDTFARDLMHSGQTANENIAKQIYKKIKSQLDNS